jgi:DNA polymerase elongation subunit (family B)
MCFGVNILSEHIFKYVLYHIDLYNYFRRDYNLTSYKLDYCAGYFIGDGVKKIEHLDEPKRTKIYSSNLMGLENGNYVVFEENSHSTESKCIRFIL